MNKKNCGNEELGDDASIDIGGIICSPVSGWHHFYMQTKKQCTQSVHCL